MTDFKKPNRFSKDSRSGGFSRPSAGRASFGGGKFQPGRPSRDQAEMHKATCSKCGATCEVPFRPNGKKPIFCKNCFVRDDEQQAPRSYEKRSYGPERPAFHAAPARPVEDPRIGALVKELGAVHAKLDALIARMETAAYSAVLASSTAKAAPAKKAVAKKKAA